MHLFCAENKIERAPSHETCIHWELKVGFFKLTRCIEKAQDWMWIADQAVRIGSVKLLVVVGIRLNQLKKREDLTMNLNAVTPLAIVPMQASNGALLKEQFQKLAEKTGVPRAILIDHGSDLKRGTENFCNEHSKTISSYDIVHKIAIELSKCIDEDADWQRFISQAAHSKKQMQLTEFSHCAPPNQRSKARWLNVDVITDWACKQLNSWTKDEIRPQQLQWLDEYRPKIALWSKYVEIARITRDVIRVHGYSHFSCELLIERLARIETCEKTEEFCCNLVDFVEGESKLLGKNERIIGSSEVIESAFGWFQNLLGTAHYNGLGFGRLILALGSRLGELSKHTVHAALNSVKIDQVDEWIDATFGELKKRSVLNNRNGINFEMS